LATIEGAASRVIRRPFNRGWIMLTAVVLALAVAGVVAIATLTGDDGTPVARTLTATDRGTTVTLKPDEEVVIQLPSNVTTGYRWAIDTLDVNTVTFLGSTYIAPSDGAVGQGGTEELRFRALTPGTTALNLKYWQPWSGAASVAERFELIIVVEDGSAS
jgi:inhibitor of cysteine peptidase